MQLRFHFPSNLPIPFVWMIFLSIHYFCGDCSGVASLNFFNVFKNCREKLIVTYGLQKLSANAKFIITTVAYKPNILFVNHACNHFDPNTYFGVIAKFEIIMTECGIVYKMFLLRGWACTCFVLFYSLIRIYCEAPKVEKSIEAQNTTTLQQPLCVMITIKFQES